MNDLPVVDLPGLVRPRTISRVRELAMPLAPPEAGAHLWVRRADDGTMLLRWRSASHVVRCSPDGQAARFEVDAPLADYWGLDARRDRIVIAGLDAVAVFDDRGGEIRRLEIDEPVDERSCRLLSDGSFVVLSSLRDGSAHLRLFDRQGALLDSVFVTHWAEDHPSYWLDDAHPSVPCVSISAALGQDGAYFMLARARDGRLVLDAPLEGICFGAFGRDADGSVFTLPHCGDRLCKRRLDGTVVWERDLQPIFDALEDCHNWLVAVLDDDRVVVPTSEGRLLVVDREGEAIELRCAGDERNWGWGFVDVRGHELYTVRSGDARVCVWDMRPA